MIQALYSKDWTFTSASDHAVERRTDLNTSARKTTGTCSTSTAASNRHPNSGISSASPAFRSAGLIVFGAEESSSESINLL